MEITFISHVYPHPERGFNPGIERVVEAYATELANLGHRVNIITTYRNGGVSKEELHNGIHLYRVTDARDRLGRLGSLFSLDKLSLAHLSLNHKEMLCRSDIIHTFSPFLGVEETPLVSHYHHSHQMVQNIFQHFHIYTDKALWDRTYSKSDAIVCVSNHSASELQKENVKRAEITVIYNGVDMDRFGAASTSKSIGDEPLKLLYVGPLIKRKGIRYLLEAAKVLKNNGVTFELLLAGGGDLQSYKQLAQELRVTDEVDFLGFVHEDRLVELYEDSDLFVFPSLNEGFGMVMVEAMACGTPVIASRSTAIPEVVGEAGVLVPPEDPQELATAIRSLLNDPERRESLSEQAFKRVNQEFTWAIATERLLDLYREVT